MLYPKALFVVLSYVHQSVQLGKITQMTSALYKRIEVDETSWMQASWNEAKIFHTNNTKGYVCTRGEKRLCTNKNLLWVTFHTINYGCEKASYL